LKHLLMLIHEEINTFSTFLALLHAQYWCSTPNPVLTPKPPPRPMPGGTWTFVQHVNELIKYDRHDCMSDLVAVDCLRHACKVVLQGSLRVNIDCTSL
jgi:hypothetical protein